MLIHSFVNPFSKKERFSMRRKLLMSSSQASAEGREVHDGFIALKIHFLEPLALRQ
jgi:hypothetical protein